MVTPVFTRLGPSPGVLPAGSIRCRRAWSCGSGESGGPHPRGEARPAPCYFHNRAWNYGVCSDSYLMTHRVVFAALVSVCGLLAQNAASAQDKITLNGTPTRVIGQTSLTVSSLNPNLVEGRELAAPQSNLCRTTSGPCMPWLTSWKCVAACVMALRGCSRQWASGRTAEISVATWHGIWRFFNCRQAITPDRKSVV